MLLDAMSCLLCISIKEYMNPLLSGSGGDSHGCGEPKRLETEASAGHHLISPNCSPPLDLNFPLPGEKGPACLVKVRKVER